MKKLLVIAMTIICLLTAIGSAYADVYVRGHYRSNGTYVAPHYRSNPDGYSSNNWSSQGNVNPYTGKVGTRRYW